MLLRDVIHIPAEVRTGDLVFKLSDATEHAEKTVNDYVVTPQLSGAFLTAARLMRAAIAEHSSKAAFLSGSFGAGKSSFMGILQLLLNAEPHALAKVELAPVVAELAEWRGDQRFLTVQFNLIGATSLESAIFGGYVAQVRALHPDHPMPDVFADEPILENADTLRATLGDEAFFGALSGGAEEDEWGDLGGWDAERYDAARAQVTTGPDRRLLVQALLEGLLTSFADGARANRDGYVDIDTGLAALSRHAKDLGYAGLILFLDELILWLMSRMADAEFVGPEASKISRLVEASEAARPVPIISLIARQRDLRTLIGSDVPGAERLAFIEQLDYQAGRFTDIELNDSNLPLVANRRLLQPQDDAGKQALDDAFAALSLTDDQRDALRGASGTDEDFRLTYPFSPAFLTVVVELASTLQRTRTGLRVLLDLLVQNRETLEVGQLVPVGDLYDVLANSDEPLDAMMQNFESAKRIYTSTLRPMLAAEHGMGTGDVPTSSFVNDDRLIKTLLLAALVPNSEPFKNLTARKLVALNHGLITSPVPGMEATVVIGKLNSWAARCGELQVGGDLNNPTVHLVLSEIDTRSILESVSGIDNTGSRRQLVRDLIAKDLGVSTDQLHQTTKLLWKGTYRTVDLVFGNVRNTAELTDAAFATSGDMWKFVIDFPFDEDGHTPSDDVARVEELRILGHEWRTVCWLPAFFTAETRSLLGNLVRLNHLLPIPGQTSDRLREATKNLTAETRETARPQLEAQKRAAEGRLQQALHQAYGLGVADAAVVDTSHPASDCYASLLPGFEARPPVASSLRMAFDQVIAQGLEYCYPAAPNIDSEVRIADLRTVYLLCQEALEQPGDRIPQVAPSDRKLMSRIANPLRLGVQSEQAFSLDVTPHWDNHFTRKISERTASGAEGGVTVGELRRWIDDPRPWGLSRELQNLVILVWAAATDRAFTDHGGPARISVDALEDHFEVLAQELPDARIWAEAVTRSQEVFGATGLPATPSAVGLAKLSGILANQVVGHHAAADAVVGDLASVAALVDVPQANRARTARTAADLLAALAGAGSDMAKVHALVGADLAPSPQAVGASIMASAAVSGAIHSIDMGILTAALGKPEGGALAKELTGLLEAEELATVFAPPMRHLYDKARNIVVGPVLADALPTGDIAAGPTGSGLDASGPVPQVVSVPDGGTATKVPVLSERGLQRAATVERLDKLRTDLKSGEIAGDLFDIEITATLPTEGP